MKLCPIRQRVHARGLTLIELLVSLTLGLVLIGAVLAAYAAMVTSTRQQQALREMSEGAQWALSLLRRDLLMAGYVHPSEVSGERFTPQVADIQARPVFGCERGFDQPKAAPAQAQCNPSGAVTPALEINFEATRDTAVPNPNGYLTDCVGTVLALGSGAVQSVAADPGTRIATSHRYFVLPAVSGGPPQALACASPSSTAERLVPGVETLSVRYGVASAWKVDDPASRRPVRYVSAADVAPGEWAGVVAVRVCVLMQSLSPVALGEQGAVMQYRNCDGVQEQSADGRLRRAYITTVSLRNRGGMK